MDRENSANLFGVDLETGEMTQLTEWDAAKVSNRQCLRTNPVREELCFFYDDAVMSLDMETLETRRLMERPNNGKLVDVMADGKYVVRASARTCRGGFNWTCFTGTSAFTRHGPPNLTR